MNPKKLTIRRIMDDASILQVFGDKSAIAENSPLQKYWEMMYKREGEESRLPYAGEEKIEKVLEFLKPRYMSQGELGIKDSKEWEIYKNKMGKNEFGELRSPEKPERIQSSYDRDVRYEMNRLKRHPDEPIMLFDDRENSNTVNNFFSITLSPFNYYRLTVPPGIWHAFKGHNHDLNLILDVADMEHQPDEIIRIDLDEISFNWSSI